MKSVQCCIVYEVYNTKLRAKENIWGYNVIQRPPYHTRDLRFGPKPRKRKLVNMKEIFDMESMKYIPVQNI